MVYCDIEFILGYLMSRVRPIIMCCQFLIGDMTDNKQVMHPLLLFLNLKSDPFVFLAQTTAGKDSRVQSLSRASPQ